VNSMHKAQLVKYEMEEIFSENNSMLESTLLKAINEFEGLKEKILALEGSVEILTQTIGSFYKEKSNGDGISHNIIADKEAIFTQVIS
jgi:uncharacterized protein YaaN involved in tellurite resistance